MNLDDIKQLLELVREHDLTEFELEQDGLKMRVRKAGQDVIVTHAPVHHAPGVSHHAPSPVAAPAPAAAAPAAPAAPVEEGTPLAVIKAPIVGTVYRAPEPGARPFAEVGTMVKKGQVLCIIEAMKLMNEIESEVDGEVVGVYVDNGQPVQFGDRIFTIRVN
ncbi:MAG: acetyl-CoA carboxylase biotin carboxyl carrier protein [Acidobacteria bacterium]|nr:acetyl-CoA carboxylase biotin carboxyl carrier protein [Acidobacteriota bacterium]